MTPEACLELARSDERLRVQRDLYGSPLTGSIRVPVKGICKGLRGLGF